MIQKDLVDERSSHFQDSHAFLCDEESGKYIEACVLAKDVGEGGDIY
jgi:hypothetical protein